MDQAILGTQIRERRRQIGITQVDLASRIGISPSYLNLIERNKRRIAGALLRRTATALGLKPEDLDGAAERRLAERLTEVAHLPDIAAQGVEVKAAGELIGRYPGWARALAALAQSEQEARQTVRILSDRLTHDPFLGENIHRMLSRVAAIRAAAEILVEYPDLPDPERRRFTDLVADETRALTDIGEALASYFDRPGGDDHGQTPVDEVEAFFEARGHHVPEIEGTESPEDAINAILSDATTLETAAAQARARLALTAYADAARALPLGQFAETADAFGYDIERLADHFDVPINVICRRLTALPNDAPQFGYVQANASGTILDMHGVPDLAIPRYAAACPLWILYRAQQMPEQAMAQHAVFPNGGRFVFVARARATGPEGFGQPRHYVTDMLTMHADTAEKTVYLSAPGIAPEPVGPACRLCPRDDCAHRVADPLMG